MENKKSNRKLVIGILLLILGVILFAQNFNLIDVAISQYIFHWQSIFIIIGIFVIAGKPRRMTGYILAMIGIVFWIPALLNVDTHLIIWPAILIGIGTLTLFKGWFRHRHPEHVHAFAHCKNKMNEIRIERCEH